jgi:energy-coupling factor transporter transmembrane protein EcfT
LLLRTLARGERISRAMAAREFGMGALEGAEAPLDRRNLLFLAGWGVFFLLVRLRPLSRLAEIGGLS